MLIELQEYILNIKEESEAINGLKKHLEKQKAESGHTWNDSMHMIDYPLTLMTHIQLVMVIMSRGQTGSQNLQLPRRRRMILQLAQLTHRQGRFLPHAACFISWEKMIFLVATPVTVEAH